MDAIPKVIEMMSPFNKTWLHPGECDTVAVSVEVCIGTKGDVTTQDVELVSMVYILKWCNLLL